MRRLAALAFAAAVVATAPRASAEPLVSHLAVPEPPSADLARADTLFAAGRWAEAAVVYHRVARGGTADGAPGRRLAGYRIAVALHYLGLHQASLGAFAPIADDPTHPRFSETLVWLAGLAAVLPEPDEVAALLGRYGPADAAPYDNPTQRPLHARLMALLGRHAYQARRFDEAIRAFEAVDPASSAYPEAAFLTAIAHVQLRKPAPAVLALQRLRSVLERRPPGAERARLLDLVHLTLARAQYSRALVGLSASCCGPTIDAVALQGAFESYGRIGPGSPSSPVALFESAWASFMAGDVQRALGTLRAFEAPGFTRVVNPEVPVLHGMIAFSLCQFETAATIAARARTSLAPVRAAIARTVARLDREGGAPRFVRFASEVRAGATGLGADAAPFVEAALSDRQLGRRLAHARAAGEEIALLARMPSAFRGSALGSDTADALDLARDLATHSAGALVRARLVRAIAELDQRLAQASALAADAAVAVEEVRRRPAVQAAPAFRTSAVVPDREHEIWPFDGELWADEVGTYRVAARSRCPR